MSTGSHLVVSALYFLLLLVGIPETLALVTHNARASTRSLAVTTGTKKYGVSDPRLEGNDATRLLMSRGGEMDGDRYMSAVRSLQESFYRTSSSIPPCSFDWQQDPEQGEETDSLFGHDETMVATKVETPTGQVRNLPILTWPWHEVPGRTNVLHVHEGAYTHLMETVLRSNPSSSWYVGHVYRQGKPTERTLKSWREVGDDEEDDTDFDDDDDSNTVVLGTLMKITDYRRLSDGRLMVLVQGVERFVVDQVVQTAPYSVANVQLLPDVVSEMDLPFVESNSGSRLDTITQAFEKWHDYEFEQTQLPIPSGHDNKDQEYVDASHILGSALTKVMPHAMYSSEIDVEQLKAEHVPKASSSQEDDAMEDLDFDQELLDRGIMSLPWLDRDLRLQSCRELEWELWVWVDEYLKRSNAKLSPALLGLLPPGEFWPAAFSLEHLADALERQQDSDSSENKTKKLVRVSPHYPALRRQHRLSYAAATLLEDQCDELQRQELRQKLLEIPSTQQRLGFLLQTFREKSQSFQ